MIEAKKGIFVNIVNFVVRKIIQIENSLSIMEYSLFYGKLFLQLFDLFEPKLALQIYRSILEREV